MFPYILSSDLGNININALLMLFSINTNKVLGIVLY
jgi:hypothetical protein